ncbi:5-oxoprolinase subunit B family protein [Corynebacterium hindlerae]|uniref:5-oxoprolinase subunit B family protein n=1 Tax=Corynebacterium hindlerae TaxID=699041 RepID=UPI0031B73B7E
MLIKPCGDQALIVDVTEDDAEATGLSLLRTVLRLHDIVASWRTPGVMDLVPASQTLLIMLDTSRLLPTDMKRMLLECDLTAAPAATARSSQDVTVPVRYDGADLHSLAETLGWSPEELVRRHTETHWTAAFGGFSPGFMYLVPDAVWPTVPRLESPRASIPAGAVGLAGEFSGVYPQASPGGWQLIGTTDNVMWDPHRKDRPAAICPGDTVKFVEVTPCSK